MYRSKRRQKKLEEKRQRRAKRIKERERYTTVGHVTIEGLDKVKKK